jgi:hypothetical protein
MAVINAGCDLMARQAEHFGETHSLGLKTIPRKIERRL